ncbi:hypothetical protein ANN_14589 [Periplaneta americana]|uniref:TGF-beta propeptide domain-containing protein n=1 Tax=Periplaneta americana TaxID=6978 RepID=A0ABQ8SWQ2_PERAM|nr:hypothetical protein ANN_14589 [Periplaneta americana]
MITTNVEVSLRGETVAPSVIANNSAKSVVQTTSKVHENKDVHKHKQRHSVPQFMLDLFERATAAKQNNPSDSGTFIPDVVRGLTPRTTASVSERDSALVLLSGDRRHLLEFDVPSSSYGEVLQSAELRLLITSVQRQSNHDAGKKTGVERLVHVYLLDEKSSMLELDVQHVFHQQGDRWLSFNVTTAMRRAKPRTLLRILVSIRTTTLRNQQDLALVVHPHGGRQFQDVQPLLLLSYSAYMVVLCSLNEFQSSKNLKVRIYKTVILPVLLYGCETWTLTLREEHRLRMFENKVLRKIFGAKRDEVTGEWRKLHNTELQALYSSPDIIRNIKSRRLRWAGHVARMGESRNVYRVLVGRPEGKRPLGRPRRRWEDNIKMDLREVGYDDRDWINLAQVRDRWRAYVRAAMNLRVP